MNLFSILKNLRIQDVLDILFLTIMAYYLYLWFRGTKAFKALIGLLALGIAFTVARTWGLFLTTWVFQILWQVLVLVLIILFQPEIRQVLERVNPLKALGLRSPNQIHTWIPGLVEAVFTQARHRIGALIIIELTDRVEEWITAGVALDAEPNPQLLMSIFQKESPLHDGALLIKNGRVTLVSGYLPLSPTEGLPKQWGTRHRAAMGLSERCDALVVVVSEERGEVSLVTSGQATHVKEPDELVQLLSTKIHPDTTQATSSWDRMRLLLLQRWPMKLGAFLTVSILWLLLAGQQDFEVPIQVPLKIKNLPLGMEVLEPVNPMVRITVRGLRKDASTLSDKVVHVEIDLSLARFGRRTYEISREQISLANDRISVVDIEPSRLQFTFKENSEE